MASRTTIGNFSREGGLTLANPVDILNATTAANVIYSNYTSFIETGKRFDKQNDKAFNIITRFPAVSAGKTVAGTVVYNTGGIVYPPSLYKMRKLTIPLVTNNEEIDGDFNYTFDVYSNCQIDEAHIADLVRQFTPRHEASLFILLPMNEAILTGDSFSMAVCAAFMGGADIFYTGLGVHNSGVIPAPSELKEKVKFVLLNPGEARNFLVIGSGDSTYKQAAGDIFAAIPDVTATIADIVRGNRSFNLSSMVFAVENLTALSMFNGLFAGAMNRGRTEKSKVQQEFMQTDIINVKKTGGEPALNEHLQRAFLEIQKNRPALKTFATWKEAMAKTVATGDRLVKGAATTTSDVQNMINRYLKGNNGRQDAVDPLSVMNKLGTAVDYAIAVDKANKPKGPAAAPAKVRRLEAPEGAGAGSAGLLASLGL